MIILMMKIGTLKKENNNRKKEKCDNLDMATNEKRGQRKKKERVISWVIIKKNS